MTDSQQVRFAPGADSLTVVPDHVESALAVSPRRQKRPPRSLQMRLMTVEVPHLPN